jgi:hypothetical protein
VSDELSPAKQELLKIALAVYERTLDGCTEVFRGLSDHHDPEVSSVCHEVIGLIERNRDALEAMIAGLHETKH